jgi:hypothetical protein
LFSVTGPTARSAAGVGGVVGKAVIERALTVVFGPSRSKRFGQAVTEATNGTGECDEVEPGRYGVRFLLGEDATAYLGLARLLERVSHWRASEVYENEALVSTSLAREMAWCASSQLSGFGGCRMRFYWGIQPRCALCPLFDAQLAVRDALGENPPLGPVLGVGLGPLHAVTRDHDASLDLDWPDYVPAEWL